MKTLAAFVLAFACAGLAHADDASTELAKHLGQTPALVVLVCGSDEADLASAQAIAEQTPWMLLCRGKSSPAIEKIRDWAQQEGLLGGRVFVVTDDGPSLWLADDMADAVWVSPSVQGPPSEKEVLRVLRPGGLLLTMELPPNANLEPYEQFYLDWDCYYNNEPYYKAFRDQDCAELCADAGFDKANFFEFQAPRYTYMPEDEWLCHLEDGSGYDDHSGTLTDGLRWYAFGCWK